VYEVKIRKRTGRLEKIMRGRYEFPAITVVNVKIMVIWDVFCMQKMERVSPSFFTAL
jgi:hypothetical protein